MNKYKFAINLMEDFQFEQNLFDSEVYTMEEMQTTLELNLPSAWLNLDNPQELYSRLDWLEIFEYAGFISDHDIDLNNKKITIYRASQPSGVNNLSWTSDIKVAKWFNERNKHFGFTESKVYKTTVEASKVLAMFNSLKEYEVIVDVEQVGKIDVVPNKELSKVRGEVQRVEY